MGTGRQTPEGRAERERQLWETADSVRETRKAIRETRFRPSPQMRRLRAYYEAKEAFVASINRLGPPPRPSWRIADDAEFERFLKRFYVEASLDQCRCRLIRPPTWSLLTVDHRLRIA